MRRSLLIIVLGMSFLILLTWLGTIITNIVPHRPTAQVQTTTAGPYQVTLHVDPNPPLITQPATLTLQIVDQATQQVETHAKVTLESNMETMDMGTESEKARVQKDGSYQAYVQFSMSGPWQVTVLITPPGKPTINATFEVTAQ